MKKLWQTKLSQNIIKRAEKQEYIYINIFVWNFSTFETIAQEKLS